MPCRKDIKRKPWRKEWALGGLCKEGAFPYTVSDNKQKGASFSQTNHLIIRHLINSDPHNLCLITLTQFPYVNSLTISPPNVLRHLKSWGFKSPNVFCHLTFNTPFLCYNKNLMNLPLVIREVKKMAKHFANSHNIYLHFLTKKKCNWHDDMFRLAESELPQEGARKK